jgi:3-oxoacyl-[acyl-carrier protein] reductase
VSDLTGRRALITGSAQGLGAAVARRLHADGAAVAIADIQRDAAERFAEELSGRGPQAAAVTAVQIDVTETDSIRSAIATVGAELGGLDILVNNAGLARDHRLEELSDDDWELVVDTSLRGSFTCAREALALLRASGHGRIINMSSRAHLGNPGQANYSAAKAGLIGLTRSLSKELGRDLITVNAVAPGMIDTPLVRNHPKSEAVIERALSQTPIRRLGTAEDVAAAVAFLASDDASYISGEVLHVTGGRY